MLDHILLKTNSPVTRLPSSMLSEIIIVNDAAMIHVKHDVTSFYIFSIGLDLQNAYFLRQKDLGSSAPGHLANPKHIYEILLTNILKDGIFVSHFNLWSSHRKTTLFAFSYKSLKQYIIGIISSQSEEIAQTAFAYAKPEGFVSNVKMMDIIENHAVQIISRKHTQSHKYRYLH